MHFSPRDSKVLNPWLIW